MAAISSGVEQIDGPKVEIILSPEDIDRIVQSGIRVTFTRGDDLTVIHGDVEQLIVSLGASEQHR